MAGENYLRIAQGYEPGEPASFFEKAFYIFWVMIGAFKVVLMRIKVRMAKGEFGPSQVKDKPKILKKNTKGIDICHLAKYNAAKVCLVAHILCFDTHYTVASEIYEYGEG